MGVFQFEGELAGHANDLIPPAPFS